MKLRVAASIIHRSVFLLIGFIALSGCSDRGEDSGEAISPVITRVGTDAISARTGDIFAHPDTYLGDW